MAIVILALLIGTQVEGPISNAIERRLDTMTQALADQTEAMEGLFDRDRRAVLDRLRDARQDRIAIGDRISNLRQMLQKDRERWTPLANLADRFLALGWKLIGVVLLFFALIELVRFLITLALQRLLASFLPDVKE